MVSTYTNLGVEKPGAGDYSNTWDVPANTNYNLLDEAIAGVVAIAISDINTTLSIPDGTASDNRKMVLEFTGSLTANRDITFSPSDLTKIAVLKNSTTGGFSLVIKQGTGATPYTLANGKSAIIYLTGNNAVYNALADTSMTSLVVSTLTATSGTIGGSNIVVSTRAVNTGTGLTGGGDLSADRTISLASIADQRVLGNVSGGSAAPIALTGTQITGIIDAATESASGKVELATISETRTGTDTARPPHVDAIASLWQQGSDISSAATLVKPSDANLGGYHVITGTTGISAGWTGEPSGTLYEFRFAAALTLTHGASFILPGSANITTAAGDVARFRCEASNVWRCVSYARADGTSVVAATSTKYAVSRQTVLSGPVDSNGLPNFGGSTGSTTVTMSGTLIASAANGADSNGPVDRIGSITNASWTGLSTNGTMYLYLDIAANGTCTTGSVTLAPTYRFGGADVVTNNQHTFNIQEMTMKVGNGTTASQTYRVFVGEVTVAGGVVTAIIWYALHGRYISSWTATLPGTGAAITVNHNLGTKFILGRIAVEIECTTIDGTFAVGDIQVEPTTDMSVNYASGPVPRYITTPNAIVWTTGNYGAFYANSKTAGGARVALTAASWKYRTVVQRGW